MALYFPARRSVEPLIDGTRRQAMVKVRDHLLGNLRDEFEFELRTS